MTGIMDFKESTGASQAWCLESGTCFKVDFFDEEERKIHFKWQEEDEEESSDIKFSITVPMKDDPSSKWMFWSENEDVLNKIMEMHDYTDACKEKSILQILSKIDCLLKPLTDPDNESDADEIEDDYYADDDVDASMPEADQDMARGAEGADSGEEDDLGANFFGDVGSKAAVARLMSDLKTMKKESCKFGLDGSPRGDNLFIWDIKLKDFPVDSKLGKNLTEYSQKFKREPVIQLEMQFPHDYPMTPPFVRVVRPRFKFLTGHITIGGSICMEMLTKSGWRPINDIENSKQVMACTTNNQPQITLYELPNFEGRSKIFTKKNANLIDAGFFDCASSVEVQAGVWVLYQHNDYKGNICVAMEGDRINLKQVQPIDKGIIVYDFDNILSSLKPLKGDFTVAPNIEVFEGDFKSRSIKFKDDIRDLRWYNMNDKVSYIRVKSGGWIGFEHVNFRGIQTLFLTDDHKMTSSDGVFQNDKYSSFRAIRIAEPLSPVIVDRIEFHLDQANHRDIPVNVFLWRQKNKTNTLQRLSITKEKSITTEDTYEFRWNQGTKITSHFEMTLGIPEIGFGGSMSIGTEVSHDIGSTQGTKTAKTETWTVHYPSDILPQTELKLTSNLTQAKLDVPFTAHFKQGNKKWEERGTYWGVQYYGFITEFEETRL